MNGPVFRALLSEHGFDFFTGVPDSTFRTLWVELDADPAYVSATSENLALGLAAGAQLAGRQPAVVMQNSGLGLSLNAFTSLLQLYRIPVLVVVGWRGHDPDDAPEHRLIGARWAELLDSVDLSHAVLDEGRENEALAHATAHLRDRGTPYVLVVPPGVIQ